MNYAKKRGKLFVFIKSSGSSFFKSFANFLKFKLSAFIILLILIYKNITNIKSSNASIILDDRAINFNGDFIFVYLNIKNFKPYWKK